jgi:hypothetical protein
MSRLIAFPFSARSIAAAIVIGGSTAAPLSAQAGIFEPIGLNAYASWYAYEACGALGFGEDACLSFSIIVDPPAPGLTGLTMSLQTNPALYTFDPGRSGPLGAFSIGGDAPPANPGVGTQALQLLPSTGFSPGAPLPGSTLTYTDVGGLLTISYQLANPITVSGDVNYFRIDFDLVHPVIIDLAASTVTYAATGPGADVTQVSFSCTTTNLMDQCGSAQPSTGITFNLSVVPEPAPWAMLLVGVGVLGVAMRGHSGRARKATVTLETSPPALWRGAGPLPVPGLEG